MKKLAAFSVAILLSSAALADDYAERVKPVLKARCYACHGATKQKGGLRLDTAESIRAGGTSGPAVEPDSPDDSLLLIKVCDDDPASRMPPDGEPLAQAEIDAIKAWISQGAPAPDTEEPQKDPLAHWSFTPPKRPAVPAIEDTPNPIDAFLAQAQRQRGITPLGEADRMTLLRRVTLDLTGLAPTPAELAAFAADDSPTAYEQAVDRLLNSPRYGERWGRHWLDIWRYSDWYGWQADIRHSQPHIWRWRDWVVETLNKNTGYDKMIVAMLAGDELAPDDPDTVRATGYIVRNWFKFSRDIWLQDTVDHTAKAFLGLTMGCARCHDHKYDPIDQEDYYRMRAFFEPHDVRTDPAPGQPDTNQDGLVRVYDAKPETPTYLYERGDEKQPVKDKPLTPGLPEFLGALEIGNPLELPPRAYHSPLWPEIRRAERQNTATAIEAARNELEAATAQSISASPTSDEGRIAALRLEAAHKALVAARATQEFLEARISADDARFAQPLDSKRAEIEAYRAGFLRQQNELFGAEMSVAINRWRLAAAEVKARNGSEDTRKAVETEKNALAESVKRAASARSDALANKPTKDFPAIATVYPSTTTGRRLALARWIANPNNPLTARVAVNHVWLRHFGEPLVTSVFDFGNHGNAPIHPELLDWLATEFVESGWNLKHLHRLIVTSAAYKRRSDTTADAPQRAADPRNLTLWHMNSRRLEAELVRDNVLWTSGALDEQMGGPDIDHKTALDSLRRSLYLRHAPEKQAEFLMIFNAANTEACYRRDVSVVPQQALALANSSLVLSASRRLARALTAEIGESPGGDERFVELAFERVLARPATAEERAACIAFLAAQAERHTDRSGWQTFNDGPEPKLPPGETPHARARENLVHVLYNHNDFITIR